MSTDSDPDPDQLPEPDDVQTEPSVPNIPVPRFEQDPLAGKPAFETQTVTQSETVTPSDTSTSVLAAAEDGIAGAGEGPGPAVSVDGRATSGHIPGPGFPAAVVWTLSVFVFHLAGILISTVVLFVLNFEILQKVAANPQMAEKVLEPFVEDSAFFIMAGEMLVFLLSTLVVARWQHGPQTARILGLRRIPLSSLVLIVLSVVPLSVLCSGLHEKALPVWDQIAVRFPALDVFSGMNVNEQLRSLGETVPAWALLLVIAVAPAISEELIFRGIIGHGLVARYGVWTGVLLTSMFFAVVHLHPAHVLTLAVFLHVSWLATRSFYAPVLIHFLNNALAVFVLKNASELQQAARLNEAGEAGWPGILLAAVVLIPAVMSLWINRVEYRLSDETRWTPGYDTAAIPPDAAGASAVMEVRIRWLYGVGVLLCGGLTLISVFETLNALHQN